MIGLQSVIHTITCIVLVVICWVNYYNSIPNEFTFDDHLAIVNNADASPDGRFQNIWENDIWGKELRKIDSHRSYRPLLIVVFKWLRIRYGLDASAFRILSIAVHCVCTIAVYAMGIQISSNLHISAASALLFASHPIHVESIVAVVNLAEPIGGLLYCIAFILYYWCIQDAEKRYSATYVQGLVHVTVGVIFFIIVISGLLFKETIVTLFGLIFATSFLKILQHVMIACRSTACTSKHTSAMTTTSSTSPSTSTGGDKKTPKDEKGKLSPSATNENNNEEWVHTIRMIWYHIFWLIFSVLMLLIYFMFRTLLVVSPDYTLYQIIICNTNAVVNNSNNIISLPAYLYPHQGCNSDIPSVMSLVKTSLYDTSKMLQKLFVSPISQYFTNSEISGDIAPVKLSFYLDESELIRKAENPFSLLHGWEKFLSLTYLHFRYFYILLYPHHLSAEYAFDCIPKVSSWIDNGEYRSMYALALYGSLFVWGCAGLYHALRYASISKLRSENSENFMSVSSFSCDACILSIGWLVIPFIPASGAFLKLGTLLAERLMYIPSIGYCFMIAIALYVVCKFVICDIPNSLIEQNKMLKSDGSDLDSVLSETDDIKGSLSRMDKSKSTSPSRKTSVLFMFIFWSIIIAIVSLYTQRTITRNLDWKTDEALFYSSLDVCPRSAKLHLQLAKLTINKHDFINASRHIKLAKEIDPDFCDIWYQEALLHIMYYNDVDAAVGKLAQSLRCVFTNTGSWTLLSQIWSEQMERNPNDYKLMENIGHIALDAGMINMGVRQYYQASLKAFNQKKLLDALNITIRGELALINYMGLNRIEYFNGEYSSLFDISHHNDSLRESFTTAPVRDGICNLYLMGGIVRHAINQEIVSPSQLDKEDKSKGSKSTTKSKSKLNPNKKQIRELERTKEMFYFALDKFCIFLEQNEEGESNKQQESDRANKRKKTSNDMLLDRKISQHTHIGLNYMTQIFAEEGKTYQARTTNKGVLDAHRKRDLALFTSKAATVYRYKLFLLYYGSNRFEDVDFSTRLPSEVENSVQAEFKKQLLDASVSAVKFWDEAGQAFFELDLFSEAKYSFEQALHHSNTSSFIYSEFGVQLTNKSAKLNKNIKNLFPYADCPCRVKYWYAHSIAGAEGFSDNKDNILKVCSLLEDVLSNCNLPSSKDSTVSKEMIASSKQQLKALLTYLESI